MLVLYGAVMSGKHSVRRERRWPRRILITANVMVGLAIVGTASAYGYVQYRLDQIQRVNVPGLAPVGSNAVTSQSKKPADDSIPPFTVLIIGSDSRNLGSASSSAFGNTAEDPGQRSDSILLVRVTPDTHSLALFSIPRDTLVPIPGMGTTRINAAFDTGNPTLLVKVISQDFGIQVNHVAQFDFATFEDIADAIGGVYQWFPTSARDFNSDLGVTVPKGGACVLLTGATALAFARSREYQYELDGQWYYQEFPESDLGRIQRQQDFVKLAAKKAQQIAPTNPLALNALVGKLTKDVKLDDGFSNSLLLGLVKDFHSANMSNIPSFTYPTTNVPNAGTLEPDKPLGVQTIQQWLNSGQPTTTASANKPATSTTTTAPKTLSPGTTAKPAAPTTTIDPASVAIEVVNGSGTAGQAALASSQLKSLGYLVTVGGNGTFNHTQSLIEYAPDSLADAKQLASQIGGGATLSEDSALAAAPFNLQLVTGTTYTGASAHLGSSSSTAAPTTAAPTTTTTLAPLTNAAQVGSATVQPDSSSFYKGQYIPPGRLPGQVPQTCPS
jgi:polyisoprenyl-teichoic acid--peptidoglycan teichoic acid transferase